MSGSNFNLLKSSQKYVKLLSKFGTTSAVDPLLLKLHKSVSRVKKNIKKSVIQIGGNDWEQELGKMGIKKDSDVFKLLLYILKTSDKTLFQIGVLDTKIKALREINNKQNMALFRSERLLQEKTEELENQKKHYINQLDTNARKYVDDLAGQSTKHSLELQQQKTALEAKCREEIERLTESIKQLRAHNDRLTAENTALKTPPPEDPYAHVHDPTE